MLSKANNNHAINMCAYIKKKNLRKCRKYMCQLNEKTFGDKDLDLQLTIYELLF